jgi:predicted Zn-dependent protease
MIPIKTLLAPLAILLFFSCAQNPVTGKKELMLMTESQEIALGNESDPAIVAQYGLYENKELQRFIEEKGKQMAAISHRPNLNYSFKILDSPVVNAFAVPGGYVYFTRGIMGYFNNEAEFAGVLGHEIGHITARHSAKQYSKQMITQILFIGGLIVSEEFRQFADVAQQGIGLIFLKFSRDHETESDKLGVDYSTKIGYDAHEMAGFFRTLKQLSGENPLMPSFLSTHPDPGDRNVNVGKLADQAQANLDPATLKVNRNTYLKRIEGLIYGDDPRQGYAENNVFYHPTMKFRFDIPAKWKLVNTPSQVQMAPEDGKALVVLSLAAEKSLEETKRKVIEDNKLNVLESATTTINGLPAITMISEIVPDATQGQSQGAQRLKLLTGLIQYANTIYKIHGVSAETDFNGQYGTFLKSVNSFRELTEVSKLNKKPTVIKIVESTAPATLSILLAQHRMPAARHKELAILNGMELETSVEAGTLIKVFGGDF